MQQVNASYKTNLQQLNSLVLVKFDNDTMVEPRESEVSHHSCLLKQFDHLFVLVYDQFAVDLL